MKLRNTQNIRFSIIIGEPVFDDSCCSFFKFSENSSIEIGTGVRFTSGANVSVNRNAVLRIGDDVVFNQNLFLTVSNLVIIGSHVRCGWKVQIMDSSFHTMYDSEKKYFISPLGEIIIGDYVWLGSNSSVSKGAVVPTSSIVAGYSLINKDFSDIKTKGNLFAGMPAKFKRNGIFRIFDQTTDKYIQKKLGKEKYYDLNELTGFEKEKIMMHLCRYE